ncbi:MAG: MFS transporter [Nanoarchaeota archaeon]|nr:MFS transporter [Nanoarchaeota archaeon]
MQRDDHINGSILHFIKHRELNEIYLSIALRFFALSMIGIFLPVYFLFDLGFSLELVMYFFIIFSVFFAISAFIGAKIATKIGFKHAILLSIPFLIAFFLLLPLLETYRIPLFLLAAIGAFSHGLYWIGHHTDLAKFTAKKKRVKQVGWSFFINSAATLLGPLVGGLILTYFNFTILFTVGSIILLASTIPLFFSKEFYEKFPFSVKKVFKRGTIRDALTFISQGMEIGAAGVLWPIFIFFILGQYFVLGIIGTISGAVGALSCLFAGTFSEKVGKRTAIRIGAFSLSALWFLRVIVQTVTHVYVMTFFSFLQTFSYVPLDTLAYNKARFSRRIVEFLVFREIFLNLGRVIIYLFMLITASYIASFIFTGVAQVLLLLF